MILLQLIVQLRMCGVQNFQVRVLCFVDRVITKFL